MSWNSAHSFINRVTAFALRSAQIHKAAYLALVIHLRGALINWNDQLMENLRQPDLKNPVMQFVLDTIKAKGTDLW